MTAVLSKYEGSGLEELVRAVSRKREPQLRRRARVLDSEGSREGVGGGAIPERLTAELEELGTEREDEC